LHAPTTTANAPPARSTTPPWSASRDAASTSCTPCSATAPSTRHARRQPLDETIGTPPCAGSALEAGHDRGVVGEPPVVRRRAVHRRLPGTVGDLGGGEEVVDAPAGVVVEGLAAPRPPRVGPLPLPGEAARDVGP